ncbi:hypothetical protein LJ737_26010 [Hymenobacter sp. 15J16-1T3B]|uniref:hypothetical protein n=1 Tax=Hymenobacter sp. 15J16-1T3B TaxID=2886941 RepID=UPI001D119E69|nr:hypothetical protein [Hymenobacter sp. 15J16-1T3B]MCC3160718.1 hypothetical protein [Hymenobacter sp. 15J16-1T3B]
MKRFALFFALFAGLLLLIDRGGARVLDHLYARTYVGQKGGILNYYFSRPAPPALVLMGNSRASLDVNPEALPVETFSLAHPGTSQIFQSGLLSLMAERRQLPRTVLLHIDLDEYIRPSFPADIRNLRQYYGQAPLVTQYSKELSRWEPLKHGLALYRHNGRLFGLAKNHYRQWQGAAPHQGFEPYPPTAQDSINTLYSTRYLFKEQYHLNRGHLRYLRDFVALCRQHQIRLICFTTPYYQTPPHVAESAGLVDSLLRRENVPYLNYAAAPLPATLTAMRFWRDATHLNSRGIAPYTRLLSQELQPLLDNAPVPAHSQASAYVATLAGSAEWSAGGGWLPAGQGRAETYSARAGMRQ